MIKVRLASVDGYSKSKTFKTLKGAWSFAVAYVGENPTFGSTYAVSDDGVCTIYVEGVTLNELFGIEDEKAQPYNVMVACADEISTRWFSYKTFATITEALAFLETNELDVYDGEKLVGNTAEAQLEIDTHYGRIFKEREERNDDPYGDGIPF